MLILLIGMSFMLIALPQLFNRRRWKYQWRYLRGNVPWETGQIPDPVASFISAHPPGKAIDLGCGMGTHALALARNGWSVTGIDFAAPAIRAARGRAAQLGLSVEFIHGDVVNASGTHGPYDLALDIGCLFSLKSAEQAAYAAGLARLLRPGAWYLLFAWLPRFIKGKPVGISSEAIELLARENFERRRIVMSEEQGNPAAWYWYQKR